VFADGDRGCCSDEDADADADAEVADEDTPGSGVDEAGGAAATQASRITRPASVSEASAVARCRVASG
jgi:hypothetical protein